MLVSDAYGMPLLEAGRVSSRLEEVELRRIPLSSEDASGDWVTDFWNADSVQDLTHLIAIERAGPSHTLASLAEQARRRNAGAVRARCAAGTS